MEFPKGANLKRAGGIILLEAHEYSKAKVS